MRSILEINVGDAMVTVWNTYSLYSHCYSQQYFSYLLPMRDGRRCLKIIMEQCISRLFPGFILFPPY